MSEVHRSASQSALLPEPGLAVVTTTHVVGSAPDRGVELIATHYPDRGRTAVQVGDAWLSFTPAQWSAIFAAVHAAQVKAREKFGVEAGA